MMAEEPQPPQTGEPRHETRDVPLRPFVIFILIMALGAVLMHVGIGVLSGVFSELNVKVHDMPAPIALGPTDPPTPQLLLSNKIVTELHRKETEQLSRYGWADPKHEFVNIPIDRAIDIVARRGIPDWRNETDFRNW